jgi:glycosyltransferase involved in cell wall biosynthesis
MLKLTPTLSAQVKSRLFPLSLWEKTLEWLIERLPRQLINIELKPNDSIIAINQSLGEYKAIGKTPRFEITLTPTSVQRGWYYLEAALIRHNGNREASILAHINDNSKESITIPIPTNLRGTVREVIYLPPNITALFWSATAAPGFFSQSPLLLHKISLLESTLRRIYRAIPVLTRFRNRITASQEGLTWWGAVCNLQVAYQRTANMQIKRLMSNDYCRFLACYDTPNTICSLRTQAAQLKTHPVISLIMPVKAPTPEFFEAALNSICEQTYPHWELLLAGDFSPGTKNHAIAHRYSTRNSQIKIISVNPNTDLATTFNTALKLAQGQFIARINQHDQLTSCTLFLLALETNQHPDVDFIYTDHDSIDENNQRSQPCFKPDWNSDLFFSHNYIANFALYRHTNVEMIGGYRPGFEGAEDYDLTLRYLRNMPANKIRHIPSALYHARLLNQTTALPAGWNSMEHVHQSGKRALIAHFKSEQVIVEDGVAPTFYHIKHSLPAHPPLVSIIIPTRDKFEILKTCIDSIQHKTNYVNWEVLIVDNESTDTATLSYLTEIQKDSRIRVLRYNKPFNYSAINNFAVEHAAGEVLTLLNNDTEVITHDWLTEMVSHAIRPGIGAVGAKLLFANSTVQHAGVILGLGGVAGHAHKHIEDDDHGYCYRAAVVQNLSAVTGAALTVKKSIYEEVGGLNENDLVVALNDVDFCLKLRAAGYNNVYTPYAKLYHHESISRGHTDTPEKQALFMREFNYMKHTWGDALKSDPAYNPNLTLECEDFTLKH